MYPCLGAYPKLTFCSLFMVSGSTHMLHADLNLTMFMQGLIRAGSHGSQVWVCIIGIFADCAVRYCIIPYNTKCIIQHSHHLLHRCYSHESRPSPPRPRRYPCHACRRRPRICQRDQIHQCYGHHHPHPRQRILFKCSFISSIRAELLQPLAKFVSLVVAI